MQCFLLKIFDTGSNKFWGLACFSERKSIYEITDNLLKHMVNLQEDGPRRMVKDEWMYDCTVRMIVKNNKYQKEWQNATKSLKKKITVRKERWVAMWWRG